MIDQLPGVLYDPRPTLEQFLIMLAICFGLVLIWLGVKRARKMLLDSAARRRGVR